MLNLRDEIENALQEIDNDIVSIIEESVYIKSELLEDVIYILVSGKDQKIHSILMLIIANALGASNIGMTKKLAVAIEILLSGMQIHGDIIDNAKVRKEYICLHEEFGSKAGVLMGDYLYTTAFIYLQKLNNIELTHHILESVNNVIIGEINHRSMLRNTEISLDEYFQIIDSKTSELFAAALKTTAILNNKQHIILSENIGRTIGQIYHIVNDLMKVQNNTRNFYIRCQDIKDGFLTIATILLLNHMSEHNKRKLELMITNPKFVDDEKYLSWIKNYEIENKICTIIKEKYDIFIKLTKQLPENIYTQDLITTVDDIIHKANLHEIY